MEAVENSIWKAGKCRNSVGMKEFVEEPKSILEPCNFVTAKYLHDNKLTARNKNYKIFYDRFEFSVHAS